MKKIILKICIMICMLAIYQSFSPILTNQVALTQMDNSIMSYSGFQIYQNLGQFSWVVILVIGLVIFYSEIKNLKKKVGK